MEPIYDLKSGYLIIHKNLQYALEIPDETLQKKSLVEFGPINENNSGQHWLLDGQKHGKFELVNGFSDNVLTEDGGSLIVKRGKGSSHQTWDLQFINQQELTIRLARSKDKYLCIANGELALKQLKSSNYADVWIFKKITRNEQLLKSCFIRACDTGELIDIPEASKKEGVEIITYRPNYRYNQRWNIYKAGQVYVIKSYYNRLNLDIAGQVYENEQQVIQWPSHGGANQFWRLERLDSLKKIFRIYCWYDTQLELGHKHHRLIMRKGKSFSWEIEGYIPE